MFKEQMNKIKGLIVRKTEDNASENEIEEKISKNNKRKIENLVVFLIIAVITIIAINAILNNDEVNTNEEEHSYKILADIENTNNNDDDELEERLENILETMVGVR